ncbi:hypothetical protein NA23_06795 [Fervidobacterium islandicum]|uniref:DUF4900 domain-containing protein n=1 Tax=Fervidobacterium islandicum TaxID=2423 RepID=A0AAI8GDG1_FERIS|nr:hypothetical protein [Fervidobacterium islandicum]AMW32984.1 hypothetical protein NA23_06795 [Fervidobacterium islandicum]
MKRKGFITALVLIFLLVGSITLLALYELVANYRTNIVRTQISSQLDVDALNVLNTGIGYIRTRSAGVLGFNIVYQNQVPQWYNTFLSRLGAEWKGFFQTNVLSNNSFAIATITTTSASAEDNVLRDELRNYLSSRNLDSISIYAFRTTFPLTVMLVSKVEKKNLVTYAYGIVTSKLLNQYIYFTNRETRPDGTTIYFIKDELIDGPLRSHDFININNAGGRPTFRSTIEVRGIKDRNGQVVPESNYGSHANLLGNPPYRILTQQDIDALNFSAIKDEYRRTVNDLVRDYNTIKNNPNVLSGIKFTGDVKVSFNHGQGATNYDVMISQGNTDYIITWNPEPPHARLTRRGGGPQETINMLFNGIIYATGNITVEGQTKLSTYKGAYTLFSEGDIVLKQRIIPYETFRDHFGASEHGQNGELVSQSKIDQIKNFVNSNETSALNLVAINNIRVGEKLQNMKIFASLFAFDGSFQVDGYNQGSSAGQLFVFGSIMQNVRGPVGTFNPSTGDIVTGYRKTYVYDPRIITGAFLAYGTPTRSQTVALKVLGLVK